MFDNRITRKIAEVQAIIDTRAPEDMRALDSEMALEPFEHFRYQEAQARAHVSGRLTLDEAQVVYVALGEIGSASNGGWASGTDLATKVVVTMLMGELIRPGARV